MVSKPPSRPFPQTVCPMCGSIRTNRRGEILENCNRFSPENGNIKQMPLVNMIRSTGGGDKRSLGNKRGTGGFVLDDQITLVQAARRPEYQRILKDLLARSRMIAAAIEELI